MDPKTKKGVGGSNPSISDDGSKVAFYSFASTLVPNDRNDLWDIFLYDSQNPKLKRLSVTGSGAEREQGTESASRVVAPSISGDGNFVAFATTAGNMVSEDTNKLQDVFVVNTASGQVKRVSLGRNGEQGNADSPVGQGEKVAISYDGSWVAFSTNATNFGGGIILKNVESGETRIVSTVQGSGVGRPAISRNGGYVVFGSGTRLDGRYSSSGIFASFTAITRCRFCSR
jgi:Tol biopolymer transport system component